MQGVVREVAGRVVASRTLTVLSHGYLLPQLVLHAIHLDVSRHVAAHRRLPLVLLVNAPPHVAWFVSHHAHGLRPPGSGGVPSARLDFHVGADARARLYRRGGVFFVSTRILVTDLVGLDVSWGDAILYVLDAERIPAAQGVVFAASVLHSLAGGAPLRAFTQRPHRFLVQPNDLALVARLLCVEQVVLVPYAERRLAALRDAFTHLRVVSLELRMSRRTAQLQDVLFRLLRRVACEINESVAVAPVEASAEALLTGAFEQEVAAQLRAQAVQDDAVESLIIDMKALRHVLLALYIFNPVLFHIQLEITRLLVWDEEAAGWCRGTELERATEIALARVVGDERDEGVAEEEGTKRQEPQEGDEEPLFGGTQQETSPETRQNQAAKRGKRLVVEQQPKHIELLHIVRHEQEQGNAVLVVVRNFQTRDELCHALGDDDDVLLAIHEGWADRRARLVQELREMRVQGRAGLAAKRRRWALFRERMSVTQESLRRAEQAGEQGKDESEEEPAGAEEDSCAALMSEVATQFAAARAARAEASQRALGSQPAGSVAVAVFAGRHAVVTQSELNDALLWHRPAAVVLYNCSLWVTRVVELYAFTRNTDTAVYLLHYADSFELVRYQQAIQREARAFASIAKQASELKPQRPPAPPTPPAQQQQQQQPSVVVDVREFRCALPFELWRRGVRLLPRQIEIGDYLLSPRVCVERKAPADLVESLKSGRLARQLANMTRRYPVAVLLVELYTPTRFQTYDVSGTEQLLRRCTAQLVALTLDFPAVKTVWSHSPAMTAAVFLALKRGEDEPGERDCAPIDAGDETNWNALEVLRRMPGLGAREVAELRRVQGLTVAGLVNRPGDVLAGVVGEQQAAAFTAAANTEFAGEKRRR